jgi:hypothetical protein
MSITNTRVTDDLQKRQVNLELVDFTLDAVSHASWCGHVTKCFTEFKDCTKHGGNLFFDLFCIDLNKGTYGYR